MWSGLWPVEAEVWAADHPVPVDLCGDEILVPPMWQWPKTGLLALLCDDHDTWARLALAQAGYDTWADIDPTLDEIDTFLDGWEERSGQNLDTVTTLWHVLDRWADKLESDLVAHCNGQDLRDLWAPGHGSSRLTWRRLGVLYDGLPGHSLTKTAESNELGEQKLAELAKRPRQGFGPMSGTDMILADLIDDVRHNTYVLQLINTDRNKRSQLKRPEPYPRPGVSRRKSLGNPFREATPEARKVLAHMRANNGALPGTWVNVAALPKAQ